MIQANPTRRSLAALLLGSAAWIAACGDGSSPTSPPPPTTHPGFGTFRLVGTSQDRVVSYSSGSNLVFCRRAAGWADLWIRFAEQTAANGDNGPHLDIDLCNHEDGGTFDPKDPQNTSCGNGPTWDIWWHDGGTTYINGLASPSCTLSLTRNGTMLTGNFSCREMTEFGGGSGRVDVLDGSFQCTET